MNFEDFLKKNTVLVDAFNRVVEDPLNPSHEFKAVSLEVLGEWAWGKLKLHLIELQPQFKQYVSEFNIKLTSGYIYKWFRDKLFYDDVLWEIAIECLGEKEIEARLKKMEVEKDGN